MAIASKVVLLSLRGFEFLMTLLIMALTGNIISDSFAGNPSIINYDMFLSLFSMISLFYLFAIIFRESLVGHPVIPLSLDVLNTIFFFCGAVAMAAKLHVHSCGNTDYLKANSITNGSTNMGERCHEAQAVTAFLWFGLAGYIASLFFSIFAARSGGNLRSGGIRKGAPQMSQV